GDAVERLFDAGDDARAFEHVGRPAGQGDRLLATLDVAPARRDQDEIGKAHHLQGPRRGADIARVAGSDEDESRELGWHGRRGVPSPLNFEALHCAGAPPPSAFCRTPRPLENQIMSSALHPMLNIAIKAARGAGAIINRASLDIERLQVGTKGPNDFVTEVDHASEASIIETLLGAYPGHGILAEESGNARGAQDSEYVWIIDPLDGTTNFIHGLPTYAVSIALSFRNQIQQAVVYDPARTTSSTPAAAAAPSSTTGDCGYRSAPAWRRRWSAPVFRFAATTTSIATCVFWARS